MSDVYLHNAVTRVRVEGKVVRLVMSAWHKGKRMKVALWLRFRSSKMADQFIVALREAPRIR